MSETILKLRFKYSFECHIVGKKGEKFGFSVKYDDSSFKVTAQLVGNKLNSLTPESNEKVAFESSHISFELNAEKEFKEVKLIEEGYHSGKFPFDCIYEIAIRNINRVLRNLRIYACEPRVHEEGLIINEAEIFLGGCCTEVKIRAEEWKPVVSHGPLLYVLYSPEKKRWTRLPSLDAKYFRDVVDAIEEGREPYPEEEFSINALEFLEENNFRMAVVEAVIGLEIVLTEFLRKYYKNKQKYGRKKLKKLLSSNLSIWYRVVAILRLIMSDTDLSGIDLDKVLKVINWRNHVVHREGKLPDEAKEENVRKNFVHIWTLSAILRTKIREIEQAPIFKSLTDELRENLNIRYLWVSPRGKRKRAKLGVRYISDVPPDNEIEKIAKTAEGLLSEKIPDFKPKQDFYARFYTYPNKTIARYYNGKLYKVG